MAWTFCTSGSAISKAGTNANSTITASGSTLANWCDEAEAIVSSTARVNLSGSYATLTTPGKIIIGKAIAAIVAQNIVSYDISSYPFSREAETILDKLEDEKTEALKMIADKDIKIYLGII